METKVHNENAIDYGREESAVDFRWEVKKLIDTEVRNLLIEETKKASQEILAENRKAIQKVIEEYRCIISEIVESEKKAIWQRMEDLRSSILKTSLC